MPRAISITIEVQPMTKKRLRTTEDIQAAYTMLMPEKEKKDVSAVNIDSVSTLPKYPFSEQDIPNDV